MIIVVSIIVPSTHHHRVHHPILAHHLAIHAWHHHHSRALILLRTVTKGILIVVRVKIRPHILSSVHSFTPAHHHHVLSATHLWRQVLIET